MRRVVVRCAEGVFQHRSCSSREPPAPAVEAAAAEVVAATGRTWVVNGRFKGGWTTRHYGRPESGVHAIQMELAQSTYLATEAPPFDLDPGKAAALRPVLADILQTLAALAPDLRG